MDADNSTTIDQIEHVFPYLENGFDVVIGSRRMKDAVTTVHQSIFTELIGLWSFLGYKYIVFK